MDDRELWWRQYQLDIDLYKHYLKLSIEFNVFFYAITGAILSYFLAHSEQSLLKWSLVLPVAMSLCFAVFFYYGGRLLKISRESVFDIRDKLGFQQAPDLGVLIVLLRIFAFLMLVVAIALSALFFNVGAT